LKLIFYHKRSRQKQPHQKQLDRLAGDKFRELIRERRNIREAQRKGEIDSKEGLRLLQNSQSPSEALFDWYIAHFMENGKVPHDTLVQIVERFGIRTSKRERGVPKSATDKELENMLKKAWLNDQYVVNRKTHTTSEDVKSDLMFNAVKHLYQPKSWNPKNPSTHKEMKQVFDSVKERLSTIHKLPKEEVDTLCLYTALHSPIDDAYGTDAVFELDTSKARIDVTKNIGGGYGANQEGDTGKLGLVRIGKAEIFITPQEIDKKLPLQKDNYATLIEVICQMLA